MPLLPGFFRDENCENSPSSGFLREYHTWESLPLALARCYKRTDFPLAYGKFVLFTVVLKRRGDLYDLAARDLRT